MQRRALYFTFQGLLTAVVLLMYYLQHPGKHWFGGFAGLIVLLSAPLIFIRLAPAPTLDRWWFQSAFFILDAGAASYAVSWGNPHAAAYLVYFLIILSTAMARSFKHSTVVGLVSTMLFLVSSWSPARGLPGTSIFWLQFQLLIITTVLLSVLALDAQRVQSAQERRYQQKLIQAERLATLGRIAGEVAHRIKAPLTTIRVNAEVLSHKFAKSKEAQAQLAEIEREVVRCKEILRSLLDLGRIEEIDFHPFDLREPLRHAVGALSTQIEQKGMTLEMRLPDKALRCRGDASLVQEAVTAVLQNAIEAGRKGGRIRVILERPQPSEPASIVVEDDGRGVAEADLDKIFQPFYTTKGSSGSGLGLSAALRILQKHHGSVDVHSDGRGKGAKFTLTLPVS